MKALLQEFKTFAVQGNVMDMAVGVVIGAAFGKIVASLVTNVIMPPIGILLGGVDFTDFFIPLSSTTAKTLAEAQAQGVPVIAYGLFLNTVIEFIIIAFAIFIIIGQLNRLKKPAAAAEASLCPFCKEPVAADAKRCPHCTSEIKA